MSYWQWYKQIAPDDEPNAQELREIVFALRNNGINTKYCCGHSMEIGCELYEYDEIDVIAEVLWKSTNRVFTISAKITPSPCPNCSGMSCIIEIGGPR